MKRLIILLVLITSVLLQSTSLAVGQATVTLYPTADNYADSKYPERGHYGKVAVLYVGNSYDHAQDIWGSERIYIRFNLNELPKQHVILHAALILWQFYAPKTNQTYETHRVLGDWNETTQNWNTQPSWSTDKTSEAIAPATEGVAVQWDITKDVQASYGGQAPNYGTMIKVAKEEHAKDASSGFWSREYPVDSHEEWKPRLVVTLDPLPSVAYSVTISTAGLTAPLSPTIYVDGQKYGSASADSTEKILFVQGTSHNVTVSRYVTGPTGVRYRCEGNQAWVSATGSYLFNYTLEYEAIFYADPPNLFQLPSSGWYKSGQELAVKRTGPDVVDIAPGARLVFDGWQLNSQRLTNEPKTVVVDRPLVFEAHYRTEYYLNVTSPIGTTTGSGWYAKDTAASFSVDASAYPVPGFLGMLGVKHSFVRWVGSNEFLGIPESPEGSVAIKEPTTVEAVWQEDWSSAFTNTFLVLIALAACIIIAVFRRRRSTGR
jgi:hypothetical protein